MCSIPGLPTPGSNVSVLITRVNLHPLCVFVELWGNFTQERNASYQRLRKDIQFPRETFRELEGNPGDLCLVQVFETWYRVRIVSRNGSNYKVFLIDEGRTLGATTSMLAWGQDELFHLPPEVEFSVLSNVLPLSAENKWSPMALEFLKALSGKTVTAYVQDVLVPHRTFLLDIPSISRQMFEMGLAKKISNEKFKLFVLRSLQPPHSEAEKSEQTQRVSMRNDPLDLYEQIEKQQQHYMYPELQTETVETVIVTEVTNPLRVFCQLKVFSQELRKLTEQITRHYEGRVTTGFIRPETLGSPCASRGNDGRWYRSVLQQVLPVNNVVEVLHIDYGKKQFVQAENIRPLVAEFFRMPVVTYVCSLHGIIDKGIGWTASQIDYLKSLLLNRTVIAKFEYQSLSEGVHYVTLYGDENMCINNLFGSKAKCLLESEQSHGDYTVCSSNSAARPQPSVGVESNGNELPHDDVKETQGTFPVESLQLNSSHVAVVQHVSNPSKFWIQTQRYANEFDQLMNDIADMYSNQVSADVVKHPTVGLYCAAKASDEVFYRATVCEVSSSQAKVFFVDYGNTEMVEWCNLRVLPDRFKELPALALKCRLADIRPTNGKWSQEATAFFTKTIVDKSLEVHVTAKFDDSYVVQLKESSGDEEKDVSKLMCSSSFAVKESTEKLTPKVPSGPVVLPTTLNPESISSKTTGGVAISSTVKERRTAFSELLFPIGSSVDVNVSYIESPNDFWCQQVQFAGHLRLLMEDIQAFYADSQFQAPVEAACVARHPDDGMWYRALVIQKHVTGHAKVLFVDYGQTKTVSMHDLRNINPAFLKLKGQAFRCSMYNLIHPTSQTTFHWTEDAIAQFQNFVDTALSNYVVLKCTIYAVMYDSQKVVFNVVDLETPFESVCSLMVQKGLAKRAPAKKTPPSPFRLDTYYYSTHGIKTGTEEEVRVTSVKSVDHFYCQLQRNAETAEGLCKNVNALCHQLERSNCPQTFGTVCFAKYRDEQWYRGQIKSTQPSILVHFVDYGDMLEVDKSDLLPIPIEASEIMSLPVQAVECGLSDIPSDVSNEVNSWFQTNMTDHTFRALVVAKEPDGKLLVELYDAKTQVNAQIKEKFHIEVHSMNQVVHQGYNGKVRKSQVAPITETKAPKTIHWSIPKQSGPMEEGHQKRIPHSSPYRTPHQRQNDNGNGTDTVETSIQLTKATPQTETKCFITPKSPLRPTQQDYYVAQKAKVQTLPKLSDLPSKCIASGMEANVFVSHCNSPWSFFVQLVKEEDEIFSIVEKLNDEQLTAETIDLQDLHEGDLVSAEFQEDSSWYRAVVREMSGNGKALVEFIDFGNTATVIVSKMCRLDKYSLELPRFSIHCLLNGAPTQEKKDDLNPEVLSKFRGDVSEDVSGSGVKELKCKFLKQSGSVWEVSLEDSSRRITCNTPLKGPVTSSDLTPESTERPSQATRDCGSQEVAPEQSPLGNTKSLCYCKAEITEGQTMEAYASIIVGPQSFWCQSADSEVLDKITETVSEVGNAVEYKPVDACTLTIGSVCIALFTDDEQWYRAEVIRKEGDVSSILFVDYGNESTADMKNLRAMPPQLYDTPPQAFLCQLEGFDVTQGSWDNSAADRLSELIMDKSLHLSILSVSRGVDEGPTTCFVQVECEGQVINEAMKVYWKSSKEDKPDATSESTHFDTISLPSESSEKTALTDLCLQESSETTTGQATVDVLAHSETHEEVLVYDEFSGEQQNDSVIPPVKDDKDAQEDTYLASTIENTVSLDDLGQRSDTESITDLNEDQDGDGNILVMEQAISLDNSEEALYNIDENLEECSLSLSQDDVFEDVFRLPAALESTERGPTAPEEPKGKDEDSQVEVEELETLGGEPESIAEELETEDMDEENNSDVVTESEFGRLERAGEPIHVGFSCVMWSPSRNTWCKAKILKIYDDSAKVLLVDHDTEMVVDPGNIFVSSESEQVGQDDSYERFQQDQDEDTSDSEDTIVGEDPINTATEEKALVADHVAGMVDAHPHQIFDIACAEPEQVQNELRLSNVCVPLGECDDVHAEQRVGTGEAATLEAVSSVPAQDKAEVHGEETHPVEQDSALDTNVCGEQVVTTEEAAEVEIASSGLTQDKNEVILETSSPDRFCLACAHEEFEEGIEAAITSCTSTQDKDNVLLEEASSLEEDFESRLCTVTHLSLKVEDN